MLWVLGSTHYSMLVFRTLELGEPFWLGNSPGNVFLVAVNLLTKNRETIP